MIRYTNGHTEKKSSPRETVPGTALLWDVIIGFERDKDIRHCFYQTIQLKNIATIIDICP